MSLPFGQRIYSFVPLLITKILIMATKTMMGTYKVTKLPKKTLAYVRHTGPYMGDSELFKRLFDKVSSWAGPKGLMKSPKLESISVYHDDPEKVPVEKQRISVGFTVPEDTIPEGDIKLMTMPEGKFVIGSFELSPKEYGDAWMEIYDYIGSERLIPAEGLMYESSKMDPKTEPKRKHLVDLCVPVK